MLRKMVCHCSTGTQLHFTNRNNWGRISSEECLNTGKQKIVLKIFQKFPHKSGTISRWLKYLWHEFTKVQIFYSTGLGNSNGIQICQTMRTRAHAREFLTLDPSSRESYQLLSQIWRVYTMVSLYMYIQTFLNRVGIGWTLNKCRGWLWKT